MESVSRCLSRAKEGLESEGLSGIARETTNVVSRGHHGLAVTVICYGTVKPVVHVAYADEGSGEATASGTIKAFKGYLQGDVLPGRALPAPSTSVLGGRPKVSGLSGTTMSTGLDPDSLPLRRGQMATHWRAVSVAMSATECKTKGSAAFKAAGLISLNRDTKNYVSAGQEGFVVTVVCYEGIDPLLHVAYLDEKESETAALEFLKATAEELSGAAVQSGLFGRKHVIR
jgi:hypothetical protein